jgi:hypothetical protein
MGMKGSGDVLASGRANKATYGPAGVSMSQEKWDAMFEEEKPKRKKRPKKEKS